MVDAIDAALVRMKKGTYGVCSYAGRKIPIERLEAIPWADVCVDCKARAERRR
jgi:RNA polymerase-binding transcription factor DksA